MHNVRHKFALFLRINYDCQHINSSYLSEFASEILIVAYVINLNV